MNKEDVIRKCDKMITFNGVTKTQIEWSRSLFNSESTVANRLANKWTIEQALTIPLNGTIIEMEKYEYKGESHTLPEWARITGINFKCLDTRIKRGWSIEKAFETPIHKKIKKSN